MRSPTSRADDKQKALRREGEQQPGPMPPRGNNATSAEAVLAANEDYVANGGLLLADALAIHDAIHDPALPASVSISTGRTLDIFVSNNGARRCDVVVDAARPKGRCKLMAQNVNKQSASARRALAGAKITHILPLDTQGRHTNAPYSSDWGCIEDDVLTKNCAAVLNQASVRAVSPSKADAADASRKRRREEQEASAALGARTDLICPFADKDAAKALGAKWDQAGKVWYVPPGVDLAPFQRWISGAATGSSSSSSAAITVD